MPILNVKMDNILCFNDFELNLSYPKKINSLLKNEFILDYPKINYRKINVFLGTNASGKTSLMRSIWNILTFMHRKERKYIDSIIGEDDKESYIEFDYIFDDLIYRIKIKTESNENESKINVAYRSIKLNASSSYTALKKKLDSYEYQFMDYIEALNSINIRIGWRITLPGTEELFNKVSILKLNNDEEKEYSKILYTVLNSFDPSIVHVSRSKDAGDAYVIVHEEVGKIIIQDGMNLTDLSKLSSGTKYAFNITNIIYSLKQHRNGIYLIDEQFSYVDSELEKTYISLIAALIDENEQVFITTHNNEILDLKLPFHSFNFLKKEKNGNKSLVICNNASEIENRNNVSAKIIADNDVFGGAPNTLKILELGEDDE